MADWKQIFARLIGRTDSGITPASSPLPEGVDPDGDEGKAHRTPVQSWLAVLGSLAMAFCIWLFVMGTDNPGYEGEFEDVPVRIENLSSLSLLSGDDLAVDLKVQGRRSVIASTDPSDIDVSVTVTSGTRPGRHSYDLNIQLPGGLTLVESSLTKVMLYLDNPTSTSVPIRVRLTDYILPDSYEIATEDQITTSLQSVSVTGPESLLQTISHAQVTLSLGQVTRSVTCIGALALIDNTGSVVSSSYVRMAQSEVSVTIPVYKYRTITPTILYEYGYFNESNVRITCTPATITVKGEADAVDRAEWVKTINEKTLASDSTLSFSVGFDEGVEVVYLPRTPEISSSQIKRDMLYDANAVDGARRTQIDGSVEEVMNPTPHDKKLEAFGFHVISIDGHDFDAIEKAFAEAKTVKGKPTAIIAKTVKGKGVSFMENKVNWHGSAPNDEQCEAALAELNA